MYPTPKVMFTRKAGSHVCVGPLGLVSPQDTKQGGRCPPASPRTPPPPCCQLPQLRAQHTLFVFTALNHIGWSYFVKKKPQNCTEKHQCAFDLYFLPLPLILLGDCMFFQCHAAHQPVAVS